MSDKEVTQIYQAINAVSEQVNDLGNKLDACFNMLHNINASNIHDNQEGLIETYDLVSSNADDISDCRTALEEIYEMIIGEGE